MIANIHFMVVTSTFALLLRLSCPNPAHADDKPSNCILRYTTSAQQWENEALPIGNGRLGAMIFGGVAVDRIQFNEESLWTGGTNPSGGWSPKGQDKNSFGSYQNFGWVQVSFDGLDTNQVTNYERQLDVRTGLHTSSFKSGGTIHHREIFTSQDAQCIVSRYSAEAPVSGKIELKDAHNQTTTAANAKLDFVGVKAVHRPLL